MSHTVNSDESLTVSDYLYSYTLISDSSSDNLSKHSSMSIALKYTDTVRDYVPKHYHEYVTEY